MRAITSLTCVQLVLAALLLAAATATTASDVEAWIDRELTDGVLLATPKVRVLNPQTIRYELSAKKKGPSGTSSTRQSGTQAVACCEPVPMATLRLSVAPEDVCELSLIVKAGDEVVARVESDCKKP